MRKDIFRKLAPFLGLLPAMAASEVVAASHLNDLQAAQRQVQTKQYERAIETAKPLLDGLALNTVEEIILAHRVLGVAHCELGDQPKATEHFETLLTFSPTESVSDIVSSKPCQTMFDELKQRKSPTAKVAAAAPATATPRAVTAPTIRKPARRAPLEPGLGRRLIPFGVGQFANQEPSKAWAFLSTEVASGALAVTSMILFKHEENDDGTFSNPDLAEVYRGLFWGGLGVWAISTVWGIIDATTTFKDSLKKQEASRFTFDGQRVAVRF